MTNSDKDINIHMSFLLHTFNSSMPKIQISYTTNKEMEKIIKSSKISKSHGYDEIPTKILKTSTAHI